MAKAIGIDLGTTNSVGCVIENGKPRVILNLYHEELTPSVVGCERFEEEEDGEIQVGRPAVNQAKLFPEDTIYSVKRLIGRTFVDENVQRLRELANFQIVESQEPARGLAAVVMGGKEYLPEDISAIVLAEIKAYCQTTLGEEVTHAVVTVPAYFGEPEKSATREAGRKAGLVVKRLLPEPTAAALAFGSEATSPDGNFVLVFDLGGGTFDISIISMVDQDYNVMEVYGDQFLGGDDFDEKIVEKILAHVKTRYDVDLSGDHRFRIVAKREAEEAKKRLSGSDSTSIVVPEAARVGGQDINLRLKVTRQEFEEAIRPLVEKSVKLVREALEHQSLTPDDITDVLLVGGTTSVPLVHQAMEDLFGKSKVRRDVNPMHCVAIGAAIMADRMKGIECPGCQALCDESEEKCANCGASLSVAKSVLEGMAVTEITTNHFGIQAVAGSDPHAFKILVPKGTEIPMRESESASLYTTEEGQDMVRIPVFEGLGSSVLQNSRIGVIEYQLPEPLPINHPVHIALRLDRQSIVTVAIEVEGFGFTHERSLKRELIDEASTGPGEDESPLLPEDEEELDENEQMLAILDTFVERTHRFTDEYATLLTEAQKNRLKKATDRAQEVLDGDRGDQAKQEVINLQQLMLRCGTASVLDQAQVAANATDEATAADIQSAAQRLRAATERGDEREARQLAEPLTSMIRQVFNRAQDIEQIGAAERFGHLLRDKREAGN